ncbi:dUTP diphosphatase [Bacillus paranthracis]|uniref:dUTP diphosphatase n=1 Tax=Bacillus paranthracis TaxID=2026186 RepID=UPI002205364A|nr:hypothetical protein [Bacillus paranthracis]UXR28885.1 deoxyuridine 5'-triphosphate nucleotidohydrolase [Bacillus phage Nachito]
MLTPEIKDYIQKSVADLQLEIDKLQQQITGRPNMPYFCELEDFVLDYSKDGDAGLNVPIFDARLTDGEWAEDGTYTLQPGEALTVKTGLHIAIPEGHYAMVDTRSGTSKAKLDLLCRTIDSPFRGNIRLALINLNTEPVVIKNGQQIAQLVIKRYAKVNTQKHSSLDEFMEAAGKTDRMFDGFNSTGGGIE